MKMKDCFFSVILFLVSNFLVWRIAMLVGSLFKNTIIATNIAIIVFVVFLLFIIFFFLFLTKEKEF